MVKKCLYCGKYFKADKRVGTRQKARHRAECRQKRKMQAQKNWCEKNPCYFKGDYWRVKEWRQKKRQSITSQTVSKNRIQDKSTDMIQDKIPHAKPLQKLILLIPARKKGMIQDEIRLRRVDGYTFAAYG